MKLLSFLSPPVLTRARIVSALVVALGADAIQLALGPIGWTFADEIIDLAAMASVCWLIGFHPLLLPTFVIEFVPVVDMLPTWTGCVLAVVALRKSQQAAVPAQPGPPPIVPSPSSTRPEPPVIDV
jgi:hypothetical protein